MADGAAGNDGPGQEVVGKAVRKKFGAKYFAGTVQEYDPTENWYKVVYEDEDVEEVDWAELSKLLANADQVKSPAKRKGTPAKTAAAKKAKAAEAPARKQTVGGKQVATGGPGQGRTVAKRVSVANPKAAPVAKKPVARTKKEQATENEEAEDAAPEGQGRNVVGRRVRKRFEDIGAFYTGTVVEYDPKVQYYKVNYDDSDAEEMEWDELSMWLVDDDEEAGPSAPAAAAHPAPASAKKQVLEIRKRSRE